MDKVFVARQGMINRHGMGQMERVYEVRGKLLEAVQGFYVDVCQGGK